MLHLSFPPGRLSIWDDCYQAPQAVLRQWDREKTNHYPFDLASNRGLPSQRLSALLVRSYRTFAPLPFPHENGGIFLWHYPHDHSHWALPSKFGLSEARTFLKLAAVPNLQPPAPTLSPYLV